MTESTLSAPCCRSCATTVPIEWLTSPVRYRDWHRAVDLLTLARSAANLTALTYHQHQARRSFDAVGEIALCDGTGACDCLDPSRGGPPMDVGTLMAGVSLP